MNDADTKVPAEEPRNSVEESEDIRRREFLGGAALTAGGLAAGGLSAYYIDKKKRPPAYIAKLSDRINWVRTGHIGVGNRGGSLLRTALQCPGSMPLAVCDKQPSKRKDFKQSIEDVIEKREGQKPTVAVYDDYRRLLDDKSIEAVFIATPHYLHGPMAIDAVEAGKHVYCEKAMAFTIGENQDIVELVESGAKAYDGETGRPTGDMVFQVGHQRHYSPLYRRVGDMVASDQIGDLATIRAQWNLNDSISRPAPSLEMERVINWRLYSEYSGGLTTEYATHQIDVANWYFGTHPHSVCGYGGIDWYGGDGRDTHDNIHLIFTYEVPVLVRHKFTGRPLVDSDGQRVYRTDAAGNVQTRFVTFDYMSSMANAFLGPSEIVFGRYGTIQLSLAGGEFWKEKKALSDPYRIAEGTNPRRAKQKSLLKSGISKAVSLRLPPGKLIEEEALEVPENEDPTRHWSKFIEPIEGAYDKIETLLAVESFLKCVRRSRQGEPFGEELKATARVGMESAIPALMANLAMREQRTVRWSEFFDDRGVGDGGDVDGGVQGGG